jgi:hypothetical protein
MEKFTEVALAVVLAVVVISFCALVLGSVWRWALLAMMQASGSCL